MNANQLLFWEIFSAFCLSWIGIAFGTHWVVTRKRKRKQSKKKAAKGPRTGMKRKRRK